MAAHLEVSVATTNHAFGSYENLLLYNWRVETTFEGTAALDGLTKRLLAARAERLLALGLVEAGARLPPAPVRDEMGRMMRETWGAKVLASALVFEGGGFQAAAVRGVAIGLALVARQPFAHKVFGSLPDAAQWIAAEARREGVPAPAAGHVVELMEELRRA